MFKFDSKYLEEHHPDKWNIRSESPLVVIYHKGCSDGFTAAWAASEWAQDRGVQFEEIQFHAATYGNKPPDVRGKHVLILDFCYPRETLLDMEKVCKKILVFDHHRTSMTNCGDIPFCIFDPNRSGAGLTWDVLLETSRPDMLDYVEDHDLWKHELPNSRDISLFIKSWKFDFDTWRRNMYTDESDAAEKGASIRMFKDRMLEELASRARLVEFFHFGRVYLVNNSSRRLTSELLSHLSEGMPFAACWYVVGDMEIGFSLRSQKGMGYDVSAIASSFPGGGGHTHAAGFSTLLTPEVRKMIFGG